MGGLDELTHLVCVRHGQTEWNAQGRLQGQLDIPLNEQGLAQAEALALALQDESLDQVFCSDLQRCRETLAPLLARRGLPVQWHAGLRERCFGDFQGHTWAELGEREPEALQRWKSRDPDFAAPGGESLRVFSDRVLEVVRGLAARHAGQTLLLVTHGGVLDCLYRASLGLDLQAARSWRLGNAAINRLLVSGGQLHVVGWADEGHLPPPA
ncbi:MAG TPA: histidine phosphatase family protein [Burkholderiaceae bacterium]|nr:histidine phosphatase family protein [Burkholderiaceae bacterium]